MQLLTNIRNLTLILSFILLTGCARNPVTGRKQLVFMSEKQEIAMGKESDPQILAFFGLYEHPGLQEFITAKGNEMAAISHRPNLAYEFKIVDSPVINAFAVPGGFIYFTRGIMAHFNNEAEFAGVLGHEIGHVTARHSVIQQRNAMLGQLGIIAGVILVPELTQFVEPLSTGMQLALLSFGRDAERQSDKLGVEYSTKIGYDAREMAGFFNTLERQQGQGGDSRVPEFFSTHPSPVERNKKVAEMAVEWKQKLNLTDPKVNRDTYLRRLEGMVYGEDPRQGFTEGQVFYHPELKFRFPFPAGWNLQNTPQQVQMAPANGEAILMVTLVSGSNSQEAASQILQQYKLEQVESRQETINGLRSLITIADQKQERGTVRVVFALTQWENRIYNLMGVSEVGKFNTYLPEFMNTIRGFAELNEQEKLDKKAEVIVISAVPQSMTFENVLKLFAISNDRYNEMAILNGMELETSLEKGTLIKLVSR
jgi:predicted Zn-dependent protease